RYNRCRYKDTYTMHSTFQRDRFTWLSYLVFGIYVYFLNILGPITPFLKDELHLTYTISSFHFSAFAVGMLVVGIGGNLVIKHFGRTRSLWLGLFGASLSAVVLLVGRNPIITIAASFVMGTIGSLVLAIIPAALADYHGETKAVALTEANVGASLFATAAGLFVGWSAQFLGNWRWALGIMALAPIFFYLFFRRDLDPIADSSPTEELVQTQKPLPILFWLLWLALVMSVSVEFCMIFWGANYLEQTLGMPKANAAQAISLFTAAMIAGRIIGSRIVQRFSPRAMISISAIIAGIGFLLFWTTSNIPLALTGFFLVGFGIANLYPFIISLAINAADGDSVQAGARTTLASGTAILALPLALGRLADAIGIHSAYAIVLLLLISVFLINQFTGKHKTAN
ncbi:MAG: MFS transporter, partial [Anaerolineales bacterium]